MAKSAELILAEQSNVLKTLLKGDFQSPINEPEMWGWEWQNKSKIPSTFSAWNTWTFVFVPRTCQLSISTDFLNLLQH